MTSSISMAASCEWRQFQSQAALHSTSAISTSPFTTADVLFLLFRVVGASWVVLAGAAGAWTEETVRCLIKAIHQLLRWCQPVGVLLLRLLSWPPPTFHFLLSAVLQLLYQLPLLLPWQCDVRPGTGPGSTPQVTSVILPALPFSASACLSSPPHTPTHRRFLRWWMVMRPWSTTAPTTCLFFLLSFPRTRRRLNSFLPSSCGGVTWSTSMSAFYSSQIGNMTVHRVIFLSSGYGKYCSKNIPKVQKAFSP